MSFRAGFVAIVGRPNTGKSTLVNALVGEKVAIVSDKPQTTRRGIRGILTTRDAQVVLVDTPGFHKPRTLLGSRLNEVVHASVEGVDAVVLVVDGKSGVGRGDAFVYSREVGPSPGAKLCAVNKLDLLHGHHLALPQLAAAAELGDLDQIVPISAKTREGLDTLLDLMIARLPEGEPLYPAGDVTDQPIEDRLAEIIREKALELTRQEVPHSVAVRFDEMKREANLTRVSATLVVERDSQRGIVIGKGGALLEQVGTRAREDMELLLDTKVFLDLRVKVLKEWQRDPKALSRLGF